VPLVISPYLAIVSHDYYSSVADCYYLYDCYQGIGWWMQGLRRIGLGGQWLSVMEERVVMMAEE